MIRYILFLHILFCMIGCQSENPTEPYTLAGKTLNGTFTIIYNEGTPQEYSEYGTLSISFKNKIYSYIGNFSDTSTGRGKIFIKGIGDEGEYVIINDGIRLNDRAVVYGSGTITGSPSLYLSGIFKIFELKNSITLTEQEWQKQYIINLRK